MGNSIGDASSDKNRKKYVALPDSIVKAIPEDQKHKIARHVCFKQLCSIMAKNPKWPEELRCHECDLPADKCFWLHLPKGVTPPSEYVFSRPIPRDPETGQVRTIEKLDHKQKRADSKASDAAAARGPISPTPICDQWELTGQCDENEFCPGARYHTSIAAADTHRGRSDSPSPLKNM